jgi:branched-chain amino acid transport system permease protein
MDASLLLVQFLTGLASASSLFLMASGLTLVFGVTRIVNFAHGSLYMLGAYAAVTLVPAFLAASATLPMFLAAVLISATLVGLAGVAMELALLRRIYHVPELFQLLATFAVALMVQDLVVKIWGPQDILGPRAPGLSAAVPVFGQKISAYDFFLIAAGPLVLGALWLLLHKTRFGVLVRAATQDRDMAAALGVNQAALFTAVLFLGAFLAGLGGALQTPKTPANPHMDLAVLAEAFVVTVVGGMGSVFGAFVTALVIGQLQAFGILILPRITLVLVFLLMAVVLIVRPWGLLGRPEPARGRAALPHRAIPAGPPIPATVRGAFALGLVLLLLPLVGDAYVLKLAIEILVFALAAFSLNILIGNAGLVSFGHAAYFGIGAYAAGLVLTRAGAPMEAALLAAPLLAGAGAALSGFFIVRLSGIYLAMLTLAFAQITYAVAFQWEEVTGGDNGIVGVWPSPWATGRITYYYLVLALAGGAIALLWRLGHAPLGCTLRAARDSPLRADAIGIDVRSAHWLGFTIAGAAAGLGGGLYAFSKGSIDPTLISIQQSVDFLVMVLLGGIQAVSGPLIGAAVFHAAKDFILPLTDFWRLALGGAILVLVLLFPHGLAGAALGAKPLLPAARAR